MPGGDRTGPAGMGPMTGRAAGYCAGYPVPGYTNPVSGRGRGFGYGRGRGYGWGRGRGGRQAWFGYGPAWGYPYGDDLYHANPSASEFTPQQESEMLKREAKAMQDEINFINQRISELESAAKKTK
ncbi:MAG: DUF5320 domain-containing protein [Candidatus Auribacterota bacterium]|nr:DUF5320 domain-containing protein [Candidatus Auribacterota bacterium]